MIIFAFIFFAFALIIGALCFGIIMYMHNTLVQLKNDVKNSYAQIDAQLQRRFDLIPNLVNTVKGFTTHEEQLLEDFLKHQKDFDFANTNTQRFEMNAELSSKLETLYVTINKYPDLKSNLHFLKLQSQLEEIEEDITYARQFYNDAVTIYNTKLMLFPYNIIAKRYGFKEEPLFNFIILNESSPRVSFKVSENICKNCGATLQENDRHCQYCYCARD
jgi:LemA protein